MLLESHESYLMCILKMVEHLTVPYLHHECTRILNLDAVFDIMCKVNVCKRHVFSEICITSSNELVYMHFHGNEFKISQCICFREISNKQF